MNDHAHRPVLIIIAGPNGSGKTTITSRILHHEWLENSVYINPDQVAQERFGDINCKVATGIADRVYLYDNSVDGQEASILFRFADGEIIKRYTDDIPRWAQSLMI